MIETPYHLYDNLKSENYLNARQYFIDLKEINDENFIEIVSDLIEKQEISKEGIQILSSKVQFGKLEKVYGQKGVSEASRKDLNINNCYGIFIENTNIEAMALWDGNHFKFFRIDSIGRLK
ncbi:hypothetical protein [Marinifilum fragile]|uniref:hypothetical protein n=1 Tax=Marinifilum fragile TaxID=570161 RepID=UPI0006D26C7E|nr:hypothetical protein [Marinifilum fragile]